MKRNRAITGGVGGHHFAAVKAALVAAFGITEADLPRFSARLEHLRRIGAMGDRRPGKGTKLDYDRDQIDRLLFVVQLSRFSIEPVVSLALIEAHWAAARGRQDAEMAVVRGEHSISQLFETARRWGANPLTHICVQVKIDDFVSISNLPQIGTFTGNPKSLEGFYRWLGDDQNSASVFDLSSRLHRLDAALGASTTPEPPPLSGPAAKIIRAGKKRRGEALPTHRRDP
jgi:hypothetical protein